MINEEDCGCDVVVVVDFEGGDFLSSGRGSMSAPPPPSSASPFVISSLRKSCDLLRIGGACVVDVVFLLEEDFLSGGFFG